MDSLDTKKAGGSTPLLEWYFNQTNQAITDRIDQPETEYHHEPHHLEDGHKQHDERHPQEVLTCQPDPKVKTAKLGQGV